MTATPDRAAATRLLPLLCCPTACHLLRTSAERAAALRRSRRVSAPLLRCCDCFCRRPPSPTAESAATDRRRVLLPTTCC